MCAVDLPAAKKTLQITKGSKHALWQPWQLPSWLSAIVPACYQQSYRQLLWQLLRPSSLSVRCMEVAKQLRTRVVMTGGTHQQPPSLI